MDSKVPEAHLATKQLRVNTAFFLCILCCHFDCEHAEKDV